jgi:hypothetical protein
MTKGQRIAKGLGRAHDKLRSIFYAGLTLKILSGDQNSYATEATYDTHWYLDKHEYSDLVAGKKYKLLVIEDVEGDRLAKLRKMTAVQIGDLRFKFAVKPTILGSVPVYEFKLSPTGERV